MCGLIAVMSKKNRRANQYALELYKKQASRGKAGFGYLAIQDGILVSIKRAKDEETITKYLADETAETILFHHRFPTSTDNSIGTTHPIFVSHSELECDYYLAHNGVITNPLSLQIKHNDLGYDYTTEHRVYEVAEFKDKSKTEMLGKPVTKFNDSESLAIEFARYVEGLTSKIDTTGGVAFWAVSLEKGTNNVIDIYFGKNHGRDLCKSNNNKWLVVTSQTGSDIEPMILSKVDVKTLSISEFDLDIDTAKPPEIKKIGYNTNAYDHMAPTTGKIILVKDKEYTSEEVRRSGHPFTSFTAQWKNNMMMYTPNRFQETEEKSTLIWPETAPRQLLAPVKDVKADIDPKVLERLETLAVEYATAKVKAQKLEDNLGDGQIDYYTYKQEVNRCDADASMAEDLAFALGVDDELVYEIMDTAVEMEEYNDSFATKSIINNN